MKRTIELVSKTLLLGLVLTAAGGGTGCVTRVYDLAETPLYKEQIGRCYELAVDCYIVTLKGGDELLLANQFSRLELPLPVDQKNIGKSTREVDIIGVVRKGVVLTVAGITRTASYDAGGNVFYYFEIREGATRSKTRFNAMFLMRRNAGKSSIDKKSLVELGASNPSRWDR